MVNEETRETIKPLRIEDILTDDDFETLKQVDEAGESLQEMITRAEEAGLDVSAQKQQLTTSLAKARGIRQAFFPGR